MSPEELRDATCVMCPAQQLSVGEFDVSDRPDASSRYDREKDYRVRVSTGVPVCVHPYRVGLPVGDYCSAGVPLIFGSAPEPTADALELPSDVTNLEAWIIALILAAGPARLHQALEVAETLAADRFDERDIVTVLRHVLLSGPETSG